MKTQSIKRKSKSATDQLRLLFSEREQCFEVLLATAPSFRSWMWVVIDPNAKDQIIQTFTMAIYRAGIRLNAQQVKGLYDPFRLNYEQAGKSEALISLTAALKILAQSEPELPQKSTKGDPLIPLFCESTQRFSLKSFDGWHIKGSFTVDWKVLSVTGPPEQIKAFLLAAEDSTPPRQPLTLKQAQDLYRQFETLYQNGEYEQAALLVKSGLGLAGAPLDASAARSSGPMRLEYSESQPYFHATLAHNPFVAGDGWDITDPSGDDRLIDCFTHMFYEANPTRKSLKAERLFALYNLFQASYERDGPELACSYLREIVRGLVAYR